MNRGYLTLAQNGTYDYVKMAYLLAMSLKISQGNDAKISVMVNDDQEIPKKYATIFDQVIKVPVPKDEWKIQNKWMYYDVTPYDETIVLDSDMLFFTDHSWWWDALSFHDLAFTEIVTDFKGREVTSDFYRKVFTANNLPNHYTGLFYFKKNKEIENYFKLVKMIFENWQEFYGRLLKNAPNYASGDVIYAFASKITFQNNMKRIAPFLRFVHMRNKLQDMNISGSWTKTLRSDFTSLGDRPMLKINNILQQNPFHYIDKSFLTDEVISFYEEKMLCLL